MSVPNDVRYDAQQQIANEAVIGNALEPPITGPIPPVISSAKDLGPVLDTVARQVEDGGGNPPRAGAENGGSGSSSNENASGSGQTPGSSEGGDIVPPGDGGNGDDGGSITPPTGNADDEGGWLDRLPDGLGNIPRNVVNAVRKLNNHLNLGKQIESLNSDGDQVNLEIGGKVSAVVGAKVGGAIKITQVGDGSDATYVVTGTGSAALSLNLPLENDLPGVKTTANVSLGAAPAAAFTLDNKEDALAVAQIMRDRAYAAGATAVATAAATKVNPLLGPIVGRVASHALSASSQDQAFLKENVTAYDFRLVGTGDLSAKLGFELGSDKGTEIGIGDASGNIAFENGGTLRITLPKDGEPAKATLIQDLTVNAKARVRLDAEYKDHGDGMGDSGTIYNLFDTSGRFGVRLENTIQLPPDADLEKLRDDPLGEIRRYVVEGGDTLETTATITASAEENLVEARISGKPGEILGAVRALPENGVRETLLSVRDAIPIRLRQSKVSTDGVSNTHGAVIGGVGVQLTGNATTTLLERVREFNSPQRP